MRIKVDEKSDALYIRLDESPIVESERSNRVSYWTTMLRIRL
jgi:hypothetical protein